MRTPILLFDLGNTLVEYFRAGGFTPVLRESIRLAGRALGEAGHPVPPGAEVALRVAEKTTPRATTGCARCTGAWRASFGCAALPTATSCTP